MGLLMTDESVAQLTVASTRRLDQMYREWQAYKAAQGGRTGSTGPGGVNLNAALGWIKITAKTSIPNGRYRYTVEVISSPFAPILSPPQDAWATSQTAYCATEFGDDPPSTDAMTILNGAPVLAQLFWSWVESNDPDNGYWAWWFTPGGGGALPVPQYQYMVYQAVSQNQIGADWVRCHGML